MSPYFCLTHTRPAPLLTVLNQLSRGPLAARQTKEGELEKPWGHSALRPKPISTEKQRRSPGRCHAPHPNSSQILSSLAEPRT